MLFNDQSKDKHIFRNIRNIFKVMFLQHSLDIKVRHISLGINNFTFYYFL